MTPWPRSKTQPLDAPLTVKVLLIVPPCERRRTRWNPVLAALQGPRVLLDRAAPAGTHAGLIARVPVSARGALAGDLAPAEVAGRLARVGLVVCVVYGQVGKR